MRTIAKERSPADERGAAVEARRLVEHWRAAVPDDRMAHLIKDVTRALVRALQVRLARFGVPFGHWAFLRILWQADGVTQRELSELADVMQPTTSAALRAMERRGLVRRRRRADDRRSVRVFLTARGRALQETLVPLAITVNEIALRHVTARDVATTRRTLIRMLENLAADAASTGVAAGVADVGAVGQADYDAPAPARRHKARVAR
jgi:MarR family transcriptional regulator, organic hydroperoxide resistance regulator